MRTRVLANISLCCLLLAGCTTEQTPQKYVLPKSFSRTSRIKLSPEQLTQMHFSKVIVAKKVIPLDLEAAGQVEANPTLIIPVMSAVPGRIESVLVQLGDRVKRGQVIASLRSDEVAQLESDLLKTTLEMEGEQNQLEAERKLANTVLERKKILFSEGINPKAELDAAETEVVKSDAALANLQFKKKAAVSSVIERFKLYGLSSKEVDRLLRTRTVLNTFDIVAPRSGTITDRNVDPGQQISTSDKLFEVSDFLHLLLKANVFEKDVMEIKIHEPVKVVVDGIHAKTFSGRINFIGSELDEKTRTLPVRAEIENSAGILRPNMFARMIIHTGQTNILAVPTKCVQTLGESNIVYVEVAPNTFEERHVEVGRTLGSFIEITSGLTGGETIAADGSLQLQGLASEQTESEDQ